MQHSWKLYVFPKFSHAFRGLGLFFYFFAFNPITLCSNYASSFLDKMKNNYYFLFLGLLFSLNLSAQQHRRIFQFSGVVKDTSGVLIEDAIVSIQPGNNTLFTDSLGKFKIDLVEGFYSLTVKHLSAEDYIKTLRLHNDTELEIVLNSQSISLDEVVVKTKTLIDVNSASMGKTTVDVQLLKKQPPLLGEVDVIRSVSALPGVVNAGEGSSGFYVRGGGSDQNLVLFDEAPVFNTAHLFGFFSVFNSEVLKDYSLYRSGISAKYGGRISSILEVETREGNHDKMRVLMGISPVSFKLGLDGPIGKKTTLLLAGRGAFPTYLMKLFPAENIKRSQANFYDANLKLNHQLNNKNNIFLSTYISDDNFKFPFDTTYQYQNKLGTLKWSHTFNSSHSVNTSLIVSNYVNAVNGIAPEEQFSLISSILNKQLKVDFFDSKEKNTLEYGVGIGTYDINPGELTVKSSASSYNPVALPYDLGREGWAYFNDEWTVDSKLTLSAGLRYNIFQKLGPGEVFIYDSTKPRSLSNIIETKYFEAGEVEKTYMGLEPRISAKYSLSAKESLKLSANRTRQNIQLISNTSALTPADVWRLANENIKPQIADQLSVGYFLVPLQKTYEFSVELYYKLMYNQVDYKDGAVLLLNKYLEADLLTGKGRAYGIESFMKKNTGDWTGWVSVAYSRSLRKIAGSSKEETINNGNWYPSNYDKPLNINVFSAYQFPYSPWSFSTNFTFSSGRPITAADSWFIFYGNNTFSNYYGRNQERMPPQYRLDIAFLRQSPPEQKIKTEWGISVYNLTFRKNPFSTLFKHYYGAPPQAYKLSIIGIAVPSLNFSIKI